MTISLRPYQRQAADACWDYIRTRPGNPALVLPTGAGKSPLMAALASEAHQQWGGRVAIVAHVQELVEQNAAKLKAFWPEAPMGVYAAGLNRRDRFDPILFCQIQSVATRAHELGKFDLLLIDEAHRIPLASEGRYRRFIADCRKFAPHMRVVGLTATPYRLQGRAVPVCGPDNILNEIAYEARIPDLIAGGFLSPLVGRQGVTPDLGAVAIKGGEYDEGQLSEAVMPLVVSTVSDILRRAVGRRCGIVFCVNVKHAKAVAEEFRRHGESVALVHQGSGGRDDAFDGHKTGKYRWLVNVNVASEGYDNPMIDIVAMLRSTKSPGLMYQQIGRGFRLAEGKADCLVLDYAGNTLEHGPVDAIRVQPARGKKPATVETAKAKACPKCDALMAFGVRTCPECGHQFTTGTPDHLDRPTNAPVLSTERERVINTHRVDSVKYERWAGKGGKPDTMRVTYQCGLRRISEWVCIQHSGFARTRALEWWLRREPGADQLPRTVEEALPRAWSLPQPARIVVDETDKFPEIKAHEFDEAGPRAVAELADDMPEWLSAAVAKAA